MSRKRKKFNNISTPISAQNKPSLRILIEMKSDGAIHTDPKYNKAAIEHIDYLYRAANREDYDSAWTDDHKLAFLIAEIMDGVLMQWEPPIDPAEVDVSVAGVPHINEAPVRDVYDISELESLNNRSKANG